MFFAVVSRVLWQNACRAVVEKHHPAYRSLPPSSDTHAYAQARMEARRKVGRCRLDCSRLQEAC
jgi:hypothetical protein